MARKTIVEQLSQGALIVNGYDAGSAELHSRLSDLSYTSAAIDDLRELLARAHGARNTVLGERGDRSGATKTLQALQQQVEAQISTLTQIGETIFKDDVDARTTLGFELPRPPAPPAPEGDQPAEPPQPANRDQSLAALLDQGRILYGNALSHPEILNQLIPVGYTAVRLQKELDDVIALGQTDAVQEREKGEAIASTADQKAALTEMKVWISRFTGIVVPGLKDKPAFLTALGLKARGGKR